MKDAPYFRHAITIRKQAKITDTILFSNKKEFKFRSKSFLTNPSCYRKSFAHKLL